jgi:hypothetical protein
MGWTGTILAFLGVFFGGVSAYYARRTYQHDHAKQHKSGGNNADWQHRARPVHSSRLWKYGIVVAAFTLLAGVLLIIHPGGSSPPNPSTTGYKHLYNKSVAISLFTGEGVTFQTNGAVLTFASDIAYTGTWGITSGSLDEWNSSSTPSASDCAHEQGVNTADDTTAVIAAKYCYVNTASSDGSIIAVLTVTGTSQTGVMFDSQVWAPNL